MVSSRDRRFVSVEMISRSSARTPPPAFLFPIQRCQRPDRDAALPYLCPPGSRRRRLSMEAALPCQPARPQLFSPVPGSPKMATKTGAREPRGASLMYAWASRLSGGRCFGEPRLSSRPVGRPTILRWTPEMGVPGAFFKASGAPQPELHPGYSASAPPSGRADLEVSGRRRQTRRRGTMSHPCRRVKARP